MRCSKSMSNLLIVTLVVSMLTVGLVGQDSDQPRPVAMPEDRPVAVADKGAAPPVVDATKAADVSPLAKKLPRVRFPGLNLRLVIDWLRDFTGLNVVVRWAVLEAAGIDGTKSQVTLDLGDVTIETALKEILSSAGGIIALDYTLEGNVLIISTADDIARRPATTMTYDVRDLIDCTDPQQVEDLREIVMTSIAPDTWRPSGELGCVTHLNGALVVRHSRRVHEALARLLEDLRAVRAKQLMSPQARARQADVKIRMVGSMKQTCLDPAAMGLIAVAGLRDEVARDTAEVIKELEELLPKIRSLGLRNAVRLALKDLYKLTGNKDKVLYHLRQMLAENDSALSAGKAKSSRGDP